MTLPLTTIEPSGFVTMVGGGVTSAVAPVPVPVGLGSGELVLLSTTVDPSGFVSVTTNGLGERIGAAFACVGNGAGIHRIRGSTGIGFATASSRQKYTRTGVSTGISTF